MNTSIDLLRTGRRTFGADWMRNEKERKVAKVLEEIAAEVGTSSIQAGPSLSSHHAPLLECLSYDRRVVAIAYVMQMVPYVFPLVGGRKVEHLHANIQALDIALTQEHIKRIQKASPLELGFPYEYIVSLCSSCASRLRTLTMTICARALGRHTGLGTS